MKRLLSILFIFALVAAVLVLVATRQPDGPPKFPAKSPPIRPGKVVPQLEVTYGCALLLAADGTLWEWGNIRRSSILTRTTEKPRQIGNSSNWVQIICGYQTFALAIQADGSLWGWGAGGSGQLWHHTNASGRTPLLLDPQSQWAAVRAGASHAIAMKRDGTLWAWGQNDQGQVGDGTTINRFAPVRVSDHRDWKQIDAGHFNGFGLRSNGTLWAWGLGVPSASPKLLTPTQIDAATNWSVMSAGDYHLVALKTDGTLWLRGQNAHVASSHFATNIPNFVQVGTNNDWRAVYSGANNFYGRKTDNSWWVCGANHSGQLAAGHRQSVPAPVRLRFNFDPWAFDVGGNTAGILLGDGSLWTCGERLGAPPQTIRFKKARDLANAASQAIGLGTAFRSWERETCDETPYQIHLFP